MRFDVFGQGVGRAIGVLLAGLRIVGSEERSASESAAQGHTPVF
jgi:hypothetical protein